LKLDFLFLIFHPVYVLKYVISRFIYAALLGRRRGVKVGGWVEIRGFPIIDISSGASLYLGKNVMLNSDNRGYHINMHSPVKLFADKAGAEISIGENSRLHGVCIHAYEKIIIGKNCLIAANTQIFDGSGHDLSFPNTANRINTEGNYRPVIIEDDVWIGANCIILPGVTIGKGSVVAAGSVVVKSIPAYVLAGGNPAEVIKDFSNTIKQKSGPTSA